MSILRQGENDLETTNPDFLSEWDFDANFEDGGLISANISTYLSRKVHWICPKGHHYMMSPADKMRGCGCNICRNLKVLKGYNDLESQKSEVMLDWNWKKNNQEGIYPDEIVYGSNKRVWWKCHICGGEWQASIISRSNGRGCPYCSGNHVTVGVNDLETKFPNIAKEWDYSKNDLKPSEVSSASSKKVWFTCSKGHSYLARISDRTYKYSGCPVCAGLTLISGINDFASNNKGELLNEWDYKRNAKLGIDPENVSKKSKTKVWWTCKNGHHWMASISNRVSLHSSCPYCSKHISREQVAIRILIERMGYEAYDSEKIEGIEYDILCKPLKLVIEYHGSYFHEDYITDKDKNKDNVAKNNQYKFIIIREVVSDNPSDPFLYNDNGIVTIDYEMKPCNYDKFYSLLEFIQKIIIEKYPDKEFKEANCVDIYKEACKYMMSNPSGKKMHYEPINII